MYKSGEEIRDDGPEVAADDIHGYYLREIAIQLAELVRAVDRLVNKSSERGGYY